MRRHASACREPVGWLRCFRGIDTLSAMIVLAEIVDFQRFQRPRHLMAYLGLVPSEDSSGDGNIGDTRATAAPPHAERESFRVAGIVGQEVETLALHRATAAARDTTQLELHEDPHAAAREVANPAHGSIVDAAVNPPAHSTGRSFERRTSLIILRPGSPKTPTTVCRGRKPGKRYESERRGCELSDRIPAIMPAFRLGSTSPRPAPRAGLRTLKPIPLPTQTPEEPKRRPVR
jgi:hypothetical protein